MRSLALENAVFWAFGIIQEDAGLFYPPNKKEGVKPPLPLSFFYVVKYIISPFIHQSHFHRISQVIDNNIFFLLWQCPDSITRLFSQ